MPDRASELRKAIDAAAVELARIIKDWIGREDDAWSHFCEPYQSWYSAALPVVRQLIPERHAEFVGCYEPASGRKGYSISTYVLSDYVKGIMPHALEGAQVQSATLERLLRQQSIFRAARDRLDNSLADIRGTLQAEVFDDELSVASDLMKKKHLRAAGAIAGVVLERHLAEVASTHQVKIGKRNPTVADLNDPLKAAGIYDTPPWRRIQHLADLRNLCVHSKDRDPTEEEVTDLITGVDAVIKTIF